MREALERAIRRLLRVPPEPVPPRGGPGSLQVFRAAPGFVRYRLISWGASQLGPLIGIVFVVWFPDFGEFLERVPVVGQWFWTVYFFELLVLAFLVLQFLVTLVMVPLDIKYRWYMITDRSLRIREGLLNVQERTMTFSNIQNVSIRQGPLQRLFGIADLEVRSAGGGGGSGSGSDQHGGPGRENLHLGYFRGVGKRPRDPGCDPRALAAAFAPPVWEIRTSGRPEVVAAEAIGAEGADGADRELVAAGHDLLGEVRALGRMLRPDVALDDSLRGETR